MRVKVRARCYLLTTTIIRRTVLVIAHRLSTIVASEQILVLEQGRVVESGTHQDLLEAGGRYSELWRNQQEREGEKEKEKEKEKKSD